MDSVAGPGACVLASTSTTTSAARSVSRSVTCSLPRRALTDQFTVRNWSPGKYSRTSAYSTPGPMVAGEVGAQPVGQLGARDAGRLRRRHRENEDIRNLRRRRAGQQTAAGDGVDADRRADTCPTAPPAQQAFSIGGTVLVNFELHAVGRGDLEVQRDVDGFGCHPDSRLRLLGFETAHERGFGVRVDLRRRPLPADRAQHAQQGRHKCDQLPARTDHRSGQRPPPRR